MVRLGCLVGLVGLLCACGSSTDSAPSSPSTSTGGSGSTSAAGGMAGTTGGSSGSAGSGGSAGSSSSGSGCKATAGAHAYFETLSARPELVDAESLRSQVELDALETGASSDRKYPVTYDATVDAALFRIDPKAPLGSGGGSTDSQQKRIPTDVPTGSLLITWDFCFDSGFTYAGPGYLTRHKTWKLVTGNDMFLAFKTDYQNGAKAGQGIAEMYASTQGTAWLGPGTTTGAQEILYPRLGEFHIQANTWTRYWILIEHVGGGTGGAPSELSIWAADTSRDPVKLYDRLAIYTPATGFSKFLFEYDTSQDAAENGEMRSYNRNWVILEDVTDVEGLLARP